MDAKELDNIFNYHAPKEGQAKTYEEVREVMRNTAEFIVDVCPACPERDNAIGRLQEVMFYTNAGIARRT